MTGKYKAILQELFGSALSISDGELQKLFPKSEEDLTDDDVTALGTTLRKKWTEHLSSLMTTQRLEQDKKFKAGQRTKAEEYEKLIRETFGVESKKEGQELLDDVITAQAAANNDNPNKMKPEQIRSHPEFIKMETEWKSKNKALTDAHTTEVEGLKAAQNRTMILDKVKAKALEEFDKMNPVLSTDPVKAAAQRSLVAREIEGYDFQEVEGAYIPMKDGKRLEDDMHNGIDLGKLVKQVVTPLFDFKVATPRKSPNSKDGGDGKNQQQQQQNSATDYSGPLPKNKEEYIKLMDDPKLSFKDRRVINDDWAINPANEDREASVPAT